jgi:hypothetical protein
MKNNISLLLKVISPLLLLLGDAGLFFDKTMFAGYVLFILGCAFGFIGAAASSRFDVYERFHLLASLLGFGILGVFIITGILERVIILALILFVINFMLRVIDLRKESKRRTSKKEEKYKKINEEELYNELDNIKDEVNNIQILEEGSMNDIADLSLKKEAEQIKKDFSQSIIVQDPKEGRYFYKENGKTFHVKGCTALSKLNKKEVKSSNSRTELLARGYTACKVCNS